MVVKANGVVMGGIVRCRWWRDGSEADDGAELLHIQVRADMRRQAIERVCAAFGVAPVARRDPLSPREIAEDRAAQWGAVEEAVQIRAEDQPIGAERALRFIHRHALALGEAQRGRQRAGRLPHVDLVAAGGEAARPGEEPVIGGDRAVRAVGRLLPREDRA